VTEPNTERIPFQVEISRIIEVLARQIYQSPLALLRENAQNAYDAILLRRSRDQSFTPKISIDITSNSIKISDNGIGMTPVDLRQHYWRAGSSGKNTPEARAAGVVGTFGIGAMANFGIADILTVETESAITGERTRTSARRDTLSTSEDTIELTRLDPIGQSGTTVVAEVTGGTVINVSEAIDYIKDFVAFLELPVTVNDSVVSGQDITEEVPPIGKSEPERKKFELSPNLICDYWFRVAANGEVWVRLENLQWRGEALSGRMVLRQSLGALRSYRSGFGLATVSVSSAFRFGGVVDLAALEPTAGREALTTGSMQLLQSMVKNIDAAVALELGTRPESDANTQFMEWVRRHGRYDLCENLRVRVEPHSERLSLATLRDLSVERPLLLYSGTDTTIIDAVATEDSRVVVLSGQQPRRQCEEQFLRQYCTVDTVQDAPTVLSEKDRRAWSTSEQALVFRIASVLETDYFLSAEILLGKLSHGLPLVAEGPADRVRIVIDPDGPTFSLIRELYDREYDAFSSMTKDFVRNVIFPRVAEFVPSSTRQGAEAFLKTIRRTRDVFEYESADLESLGSVWEEYLKGLLTMTEAAARSTYLVERNYQFVDSDAARSVREVVPDVVQSGEVMPEAQGLETTGPAPPILRTEISSEAKLLTVEQSEPPVQGYRCFLALSDRAREERGEFFLQPHATSIVWGGQKVLFVFEHHSGQFGLYYDLQTAQAVSSESGGGPFPTATIVLHDKIFVPVPAIIASAFIPKPAERKRFEIKCDLLFTDQ
jgi:molecular chaperone HtpG